MGAVRVLFWIWVAVSVAILAYRGVRAISRRGTPAATSGLGAPTDSPAIAADPLRPPAHESGPGAVPPPVVQPTSPSPPPGTPSSPAAGPPQSPVPPAAAATPSALFGPVPDGPRSPSPVDQSLAEMLAGISMPCDLLPLTGARTDVTTREAVAFSTSGHPAETVAGALRAELERLGFQVEAFDEASAVAIREQAQVGVRVHRNPAALTRRGEHAFPGVAAGSVVVELWRT